MKIVQAARKKETWVDAEGKVVYIKGVPHKEPRLTWRQFREFMTSNTGSITVHYGNIIDFDEDFYNTPIYENSITYYAPFKRDINDFKDDTYKALIERVAKEYAIYQSNPLRQGFGEEDRDDQKIQGLAGKVQMKVPDLPLDEIISEIQEKINELV